jgi:hypothetical protein
MSPTDVTREACDSEEHPNSVPIIIALDVTGSMGFVPHEMIKDGLPNMVQAILDEGVADPQILFMGIGDHECDISPLQVGQFESSDELMDKWLQSVFLEGGGGGNRGESYMLAWLFAAYRTRLDCMDERGKKGILFTIGDEPNLPKLPASAQKNLLGQGQYSDITSAQLLAQAQELYEVYHINIGSTGSGRRKHVKDGWIQTLGDHALFVQDHHAIPEVIAATVAEHASVSLSDAVADEVESDEPSVGQENPSLGGSPIL